MNGTFNVRGIRGATTVAENSAAEIIAETGALLKELAAQNKIAPGNIAAVFFSATADLNAAFPAKAARQIMGWHEVPLFCQVEIDVPDALKRCIRVLILINTDIPQDKINHVYLKESVCLRS